MWSAVLAAAVVLGHQSTAAEDVTAAGWHPHWPRFNDVAAYNRSDHSGPAELRRMSQAVVEGSGRNSDTQGRTRKDFIQVAVSGFHINVDEAMAAGRAMGAKHPSVHAMMATGMSPTHPNVDAILRDPVNNPMPSTHPKIERFLLRNFDLPVISIAFEHPDVDQAYANGEPMSDRHPSVQNMYVGHLPAGHPNCDALLRNPGAHPMPWWHPPLNSMVERRSFWSPGIIFSVMCAGVLVFAYLHRVAEWGLDLVQEHRLNSSRARADKGSGRHASSPTAPVLQPLPTTVIRPSDSVDPVHFPQSPDGDTPSHPTKQASPSYLGSSIPGSSHSVLRSRSYVLAMPKPIEDEQPERVAAQRDHHRAVAALPRRSRYFHEMHERHAQHRAEHPMYEYEEVADRVPHSWVARELSSSWLRSVWIRLMETRIPATQWTTGNVFFCFFYLALNGVAWALSPTFSPVRAAGSLAVANTMFLVMPATRNNVLTWFLGLPFDHIILHHRFLGRVVVFFSFLHGAFYFDRFLKFAHQNVFWTGMAALLCCLGIAATTTDYMRRQQFNVFFWTHYLFVGFFVFAYAHDAAGRPFLATAAGIYILDKLLRVLWTLSPRRTHVFWNPTPTTTQVRWGKNPLSRLMGKHKVGQYVFVNFPELSLTEWHPFSVSSAPNDDFVEVHIRALGNHTERIVEYAETCAREGKQTLVRSDGPYGYLDFNYRRYGVGMFVGGGIGFTPALSLLKDIYGEKRSTAPHCMRHIYAVWIMPKRSEAVLFMDTLKELKATAEAEPTLPDLTVQVFCTREKEKDPNGDGMVLTGRPDFSALMTEATERFARSSMLVFACGPGKMVNQLWDEATSRNTRHQRIDFHHETFEF